ncbi:MAG TPA: type II toxin-antitoxin system RelE/ParE family toxin [Isosphaeraceae bacterium]|jgi:mRNA-degrading endonuclease RelE of RelBE toxin-antitoxin system
MAFEIEFSEDAERHIRAMIARDRAIVLDAIEQQLTHEPDVATRHRKHLRPNPLADWELRVGDYRVFYSLEMDRGAVLVLAIGTKIHNTLTIEGKEYPL